MDALSYTVTGRWNNRDVVAAKCSAAVAHALAKHLLIEQFARPRVGVLRAAFSLDVILNMNVGETLDWTSKDWEDPNGKFGHASVTITKEK